MSDRTDEIFENLAAIMAELEQRTAERSRAEAMVTMLAHAFAATLAAGPPKQKALARSVVRAWQLNSVGMPQDASKAFADGAAHLLAMLDGTWKGLPGAAPSNSPKDDGDKVVPLRP
jgi:hypothetical protein